MIFNQKLKDHIILALIFWLWPEKHALYFVGTPILEKKKQIIKQLTSYEVSNGSQSLHFWVLDTWKSPCWIFFYFFHKRHAHKLEKKGEGSLSLVFWPQLGVPPAIFLWFFSMNYDFFFSNVAANSVLTHLFLHGL